MDKNITYSQKDYDFPLLQFVDPDQELEKTASAEYSPEIQNFVSGLEKKANTVYALVNALTAGEYFGPNKNGDYFPEDALKQHHPSFVDNGHVYSHHVNKDPKKSLGDILFSMYNDKMKRVELVISLDASKESTKKILKRLTKGEMPATSMGCFKGNAKVVLPDGTSKYIANIKIGDYVLTHKGNKKRVTELQPRFYKGNFFEFNVGGKYTPNIECTEEHPLLVFTSDQWWTLDSRSRKIRNKDLSISDAIWKNASEVTEEDYLIKPKIKPIDAQVDVNQHQARLLGYYLAEGYARKSDNGVNFSVNNNDESFAEIPKIANKLGLKLNVNPNSSSDAASEFTIYDADLKQLCLKYCNTGAHEKTLNQNIFNWPTKFKKLFLGAVISGDGFYFEESSYISSCNKSMLVQLQYLAEQLGINSKIYKNVHKAGKGFSKETTIEWILRLGKFSNTLLHKYSSKITDTNSIQKSGNGGPYHYETFTAFKINSIKTSYYKGPVFNFEVQDDNSYCVEGFAVHNCKVPHDVCSICNNKAKTRKHYCSHLKEQMNAILPDGRRVYANNLTPKFFDISLVTIPADPTSNIMAVFGLDKVANFLDKKSARKIQAEIDKEIEGEISHVSDDPDELILSSQKRLSQEQIEKLSQYPFEDVLSTFLGMRIMPLREDFQKLALYTMGKKELADRLEKEGKVFQSHPQHFEMPDDVSLDRFDEKIAEVFNEDDIKNMSLTKPLVVSRVLEKAAADLEDSNVKQNYPPGTDPRSYIKRFFVDLPSGDDLDPEQKSPVKNPVVPMTALGSLYAGWAKLFGKTSQQEFTKFLHKSPWLTAPLLFGGAAMGTAALQEHQFNKKAAALPKPVRNALIATPISYYGSGQIEHKFRRGEKITAVEDFVRKHPFLTSIIGTVGATSLEKGVLKKLKKNIPSKGDDFFKGGSAFRLKPEHVNQLYSDLLE